MLSIWGAFWEAFGRLWGGFWEGFGRVWEPFGHSWRLSGPFFAFFAGVDCFLLVLDAFGGLGGVWGGFLLGFAGLGMTIREWVLLGAGPIAEGSEALWCLWLFFGCFLSILVTFLLLVAVFCCLLLLIGGCAQEIWHNGGILNDDSIHFSEEAVHGYRM